MVRGEGNFRNVSFDKRVLTFPRTPRAFQVRVPPLSTSINHKYTWRESQDTQITSHQRLVYISYLRVTSSRCFQPELYTERNPFSTFSNQPNSSQANHSVDQIDRMAFIASTKTPFSRNQELPNETLTLKMIFSARTVQDINEVADCSHRQAAAHRREIPERRGGDCLAPRKGSSRA